MDCHERNANLAKPQAEMLAQMKSRRSLQDGSALKGFVAKQDNLSLVPGIHKVEEKANITKLSLKLHVCT